MNDSQNNPTPEFDPDLDFDLIDEDLAATEVTPDAVAPKERRNTLALFSRIPVTLTLEVASVEITLADLINVGSDSVIELDKLAGEPLDVKINGVLFGTAEVVIVNDKYGLRLIDFNNKELGELAQ